MSRREAAQRFGIDRGTVSKMLKHSTPPGNRNRGFRPGKIILGNVAMAIDISGSFLLGGQVCATAKNCFVMANEQSNPARAAPEDASWILADPRRPGVHRKPVGPGLVRGVKTGGLVCSSNVAGLAER